MIDVAVVGATGAVGKELLTVLEQARFPVGRLTLYASERSAGATLCFRGGEHAVLPLDAAAAAAHDEVFLCAGAGVTRAVLPALRRGRARVSDNTSALRLDPRVPLVVPEVNGARVQEGRGHVCVPNCTAVLLCHALAPLQRAFGLKSAWVASYQAVSGAGRRELERLGAELRADLLGEAAPAAPHPLAFNAVPFIGGVAAAVDAACGVFSGEEIKVAAETRKILEQPDLEMAATCVRVPVLRAHSEAVFVELKSRPALEEVRAALHAAPSVELRDEPEKLVFPTPRAASGGDGIHVGRLRRLERPGSFAFFLAGDQLRKGAALTAVQIAQLQWDLPVTLRIA